jgi:antitoxin FitA
MLASPAMLQHAHWAVATITIRNLDDELKHLLRVRAARHSRSMEEEAREILRASLAAREESPRDLAETIRRRFAPLGGVDLELPPREPLREPPTIRR